MQVTVDISENDLKDILRFTDKRKKGPAIAQMVASALKMCRREEFCRQVMDKKITVDFPSWESTKMAERKVDVWTK